METRGWICLIGSWSMIAGLWPQLLDLSRGLTDADLDRALIVDASGGSG